MSIALSGKKGLQPSIISCALENESVEELADLPDADES
jgi:hypothetical protein